MATGFGLLALMLTASASDTAGACGNEVEAGMDQRVQAIGAAERLLRKGEPERAVEVLNRGFSRYARMVPGKSGVNDRALTTLATALVRLDGNVAGKEFKSETQAQRIKNLRWAAHVLQALSLRKKGGKSAALQTRLGEAWAALPDKQVEAKGVLEDLEKKDLLATSYGYAALSRLRATVAADRPSWLRQPLRALEAGRMTLSTGRCLNMSKGAKHCTAGSRQPPTAAEKKRL